MRIWRCVRWALGVTGRLIFAACGKCKAKAECKIGKRAEMWCSSMIFHGFVLCSGFYPFCLRSYLPQRARNTISVETDRMGRDSFMWVSY